jgi:endonuclease/exonuclease/phosphatase family metal-dependent hydrolase
MTSAFSIATWNIHKGFSQFNRSMMVHELRDRLRALNADIVFLQEVQGLHLKHAARHAHWPEEPQHEFLAADVWHNHAYGQNVVYDHGHHGNAILSRFPILHTNTIKTSPICAFERRGLLALHAICAAATRPAAALRVRAFVALRPLAPLAARTNWPTTSSDSHAAPTAPLLIAGDFNDWRNHAGDILAQRLGLA